MVIDFFGILGIGATTFVATNIDDLIILIAFFANSHRFPLPQIVLGQYSGMGALLAISIVGSLIALIVPDNLIGLIGIFPIAIGIRELLELLKNGDNNEEEEESAAKQLPQSRRGGRRLTAYLPFLTVAAVTFSGGEEIGIYTSVFATYHEVSEIIIIVLVVMVLTGVWCTVAYHLVNRPQIASSIKRIGTVALPFVLIGLGIYILVEAFLLISSFLLLSLS
jgi:cadmium resistance protein CadD (predicted permease)